MITVSMPVWRTPQLGRAVESVLAQPVDLHLVVVADGEPVDLVDERLTVFQLETNRGRYWCDAVTLAACQTEFWTPHDADDWSTPDRFPRLLDAIGSEAAVFSHALYHKEDGDLWESRVRLDRVEKDKLATIARYPAGLYRTEAARSIGIHPELRGSFDTAFLSLLFQAYDPVVVDDFLYHVHKRPGSLTTSAHTGMKTKWRRRQQTIRRNLHSQCVRSPQSEWPEIMSPSPTVADAFAADVDRLKGTLSWL